MLTKKFGIIRLAVAVTIFSSAFQLSGCSAVHTAVKKRNLDVETRMSETIFLEPVAPEKRIIFVDLRNTSDRDLPVKEEVLQAIQAHGYRLTDNPEAANYMLQANILQVGKSDERSANSALAAGFGGALAGAAIGGIGNRSNQGVGMATGGLLGAAAGIIGDAMVDDTLYTMITDIQVRERPLQGEVITQSQNTSANQGSSTRLNQNVSGGNVQWKIYRTRIVSTANQVNLEFAAAEPQLVSGLIHSISGIF